MSTLSPLPDVNIKELEKAWDLSRTGLKGRAKALGIELLRPSIKATFWPAEYVEAGHDLDRWCKSGKRLSEHPAVLAVSAESTASTVSAPSAESTLLTASTVSAPPALMLKLVTAITAISSAPAISNPVPMSQQLADIADKELPLSCKEMAKLLGKKAMYRQRDKGRQPRPGFAIYPIDRRTKPENQKLSTFWIVKRVPPNCDETDGINSNGQNQLS